MLLSIVEFRKLRAEIASYECACFEDLRLFSYQTILQIKNLTRGKYEVKNDFFKTYINDVVLPNLNTIEDFLQEREVQEDKLEFKCRSIKYHFNFIIDSCMYANMVNYKD